jgi:hypothetical protein
MKTVYVLEAGYQLKSEVIGDLAAEKIVKNLRAKGVTCYTKQARISKPKKPPSPNKS